MRTVRSFISFRRRQLADHPFFERLQRDLPLESLRPFLPNLTFWAMAFQRDLGLAESRIESWRLSQVARQQRARTEGLERCFIGDLLELQGPAEPRDLAGPRHELVRESTYALSFEVLRAADDYERLALLLALEAMGFTLFAKLAGYLERVCARPLRFPLAYQGRSPRARDDAAGAFLSLLELPPESRDAACAVVDRVFLACATMLDGFEALLSGRAPEPRPSGDFPTRAAGAPESL